MQWERHVVNKEIVDSQRAISDKILTELELFFAGETMRKGYEYIKVERKLQELRQKYVEANSEEK